MSDQPPDIACTLSAAEHAARVRWIDDLNATALRDYRRDGARIDLVYHPAATARVAELVEMERQCCPFLNFTLDADDDAVVLVIEAPHDTADSADALFEPYLPT